MFMIDIHCHMLPHLDNGPETIFGALELARQAVVDGVTHCVVTPHIRSGRFENSSIHIRDEVAKFRLELAKAQIPLTIGFGGEVRISPEIMTMLPERQIPFLGVWEEHKVILLEMPHSHILPGTDKIVKWLMNRGVIPMIAHPERNKDVMRRLDKLFPLIDLGCLIQVTAGSLIGQFGEAAQKRAASLLKMGAVTVLASDAHHVIKRPVNLSKGRSAAAQLVGDEKAIELVYNNPLKIVGEQFTVSSDSVNRVHAIARP